MSLKEQIEIKARFQRAIRIDSDLNNPESIEGFICPQSSADALLNMVRHISGTGQCAFTWTGPYGSGKSSLLVALGSLLSNDKKCRAIAREALGSNIAEEILETLPPKTKGWKIVPVVGRKDSPLRVIAESLQKEGLLNDLDNLSETSLIEALLDAAKDKTRSSGGLILFIDEMGKFLEDAASSNSDIYLFQQLAEAASRSNNRLILIGVLHQAFGEYAHRLSREMRDEWSKIQGRFIDLSINVAGEEQLDLLSRAITSAHPQSPPGEAAQQIASIVKNNKRGTSDNFAELLEGCWPLHPLVACLLGPLSRRRFGQNQRSLFGFLNSAEPNAFRDFIAHAHEDRLYDADLLWDYLRTNLEPTILTSPDGHRWSLATEAVERCESQVTQGIHLSLLKAIALIDLFKGSSGLTPNIELLKACFPETAETDILLALDQLKKWSFVIFKKHLNAYAIYAGSDFDIDEAVEQAREEIRTVDFKALKRIAGLQPILAKRHYHKTGALRWFEIDIVPLNRVVESIQNYMPENEAIGQFLLAVSTEGERKHQAEALCTEAASYDSEWDVIVGLSNQSWTINDLALEILALEKVFEESSDLAGDSVARREIRARLADLQSKLEAELNRAFDHATWYPHNEQPKNLSRKALSVLASELADQRFPSSPQIHNELLNRIKPSSNAIAAQNALLKHMVTYEGKSRLNIDGFPAEGGLFSAILDNSGIYHARKNEFVSPEKLKSDPCNLKPIWKAATDYLQKNSDRTVSVDELYEIWRCPPYGVRDGLMPTLATAYILSQRSILAFYRAGIFQSKLKDLDVEILAKIPRDIQVRYMDLSEVSKSLLSGMADIVRDLDENNRLQHLEPIDVARGLISIFDNVHPWAHRTMRLSKEAIRIRNLFKKANDPNKLIFDDIPDLLEIDIESGGDAQNIIQFVELGLKELKKAYPSELNRLREMMLAELQVHSLEPQALAELRERAENIKEVSGDFKLESFVVRLCKFDGSDSEMEGIASLATSKPPRNWIDNDVDRAKVEIASLAQKFIRTEAFARVKDGREDKRQSLAVVVGLNGRPTPLHQDFDVADTDRKQINNVIQQLEKIVYGKNETNKNVMLAALAELCARFIQENSKEDSRDDKAAS